MRKPPKGAGRPPKEPTRREKQPIFTAMSKLVRADAQDCQAAGLTPQEALDCCLSRIHSLGTIAGVDERAVRRIVQEVFRKEESK